MTRHSSLPSRRRFLQFSAVAAGLSAASWSRVQGANGRLRVASIGTGGKGWSDLTATADCPKVDVVALCDIDESAAHLGRAAERFPKAKNFFDWRRLLDDAKSFDAVIVSTPDHMHAPIALPAMQLGKHVQCQKPLTHTVYEARQMRLAANKFNLVTQMGNQIQSHPAYRTAVRLVQSGSIGKVRAVHSWQSGPMSWILADDRPAGGETPPATVHWDEWLGVAPTRPYLPKLYHSFNWRAWQDFSNGQLGDFGCHILDPVFMALKLTAPLSIRAEAPPLNREVWNKFSTVAYEFPGTEFTAGPSIPVTWYDGAGRFPPMAALGLPEKTALPGSGSVLVGEKGSLLIPHVAMPKLFPEEKFAELAIVPEPARNHYVSWALACLGEDVATSNFDYSGPLTETVLLGTVAVRNPGVKLSWNAEKMELSGALGVQSLLTKPYRSGWEPKWL
jgi:predicted dehydrogenase